MTSTNKAIKPMPHCIECQDEYYVLIGQPPIQITNCANCNPNNDKPMGEYVGDWVDKGIVKFIEQKNASLQPLGYSQ